MKRKKNLLGIFAVLLCAAVLISTCAACSSGSPSNTKTSARTNMAQKSVAQGDVANQVAADANGLTGEAATASAAAGSDSAASPSPAAGAAAAVSSQKIIERLSYVIETVKFDDSVKMVQSLCTELGGYMQDSNVTGNGELQQGNLRQATFTLRIPQEKLKELKTRAIKIGSVLSSTSSSENVSEKYFDTEARLKSLRTQQESLLALMKKSGSLADVIALQKALADVNYQIEQMTGSLREYDSLINYSTVTIQLSEVVKTTELERAPVTVGDKIAQQFKASLNALGALGEGLLVFFIGGAPIILLLVIIAVVSIVIIRKRKKRSEKRTAGLLTTEQPPEDEHTDQ